jgi:Ca-activated chloride channel homolog
MLFSFAHPQYLFLLLLIPLFLVIHFFSLSNRKKVALKFANFEAIGRIQGIDFFSKNIIILFLNIFIVFLMIISLSGFTVNIFKDVGSSSFVIAIDSSQSMNAEDISPNRITIAKEIAGDFIDKVPFGTKIGVISFSGVSYIEQDLSLDKFQLKYSVNDISLLGLGGTSLYGAVITSSNLLIDEENKAIILLSDGQINVGSLEDIINHAVENNIIIHTVGIGTEEGGDTGYGFSKVDEDSLKSISHNTGGNYFKIEDSKSFSKDFLSSLELTKKSVSVNLTNYLLLFAIIIFLIEFFLVNTRYLNIF